MIRQKFIPRTIYLRTESQKQSALALIANLPLYEESPLQLDVHEMEKPRTQDQNALMWSGPLKDMEIQAYVSGKTYSATVWHEFFKREFLPDEYDQELTKKGYRKWEFSPSGERVLVGSTTQLTTKGMSQYLEQIHAYGANLGVMFHVK